MSVIITTKFYEYTTPAWHDLSTVAFTSPYMSTPQSAGTRDHILPGVGLNLGTWYEDTSNMHLIFYEQILSEETYYPAEDPFTTVSGFDIRNSVKFEVTFGTSINNRLTAWDDVTHSSTNNYLITNDHVKVSAVAYRHSGTEQSPTDIEEVHPPAYNKVIKGNTTVSGVDNYYGDFDMVWSGGPPTYKDGDILIFRPLLDNITASVPYGTHDFVITLHFTYT